MLNRLENMKKNTKQVQLLIAKLCEIHLIKLSCSREIMMKFYSDYVIRVVIKNYTIVFAAGVLPVRKIRKKKFFSWENCEELDKLAELNKKINCGLTLSSLRNNFVKNGLKSADNSLIFPRDNIFKHAR